MDARCHAGACVRFQIVTFDVPLPRFPVAPLFYDLTTNRAWNNLTYAGLCVNLLTTTTYLLFKTVLLNMVVLLNNM